MTHFEKHVAAARLYPATTQKAAIASARALGVMIRREAADAGEARGFEVYPVGSPESALYAECPREALFMAEALAADIAANRLAMFGPRPTLRGMAEAIAARASSAAGLAIGDCVGSIETIHGCPVAVFSGPWGVVYRMELNTGEPMAEHATRAAAAAEAAADEIAAHAAEAGGSWLVSDMVREVAARRAAEAYTPPADVDSAIRAATVSGPHARPRELAEEAPAPVQCYDAAPQHGGAAAMFSGESVVPVFNGEGEHVATLRKLADSDCVSLDALTGEHVRTFPGRPTVAGVRRALAGVTLARPTGEAADVPTRLNGRPVIRAEGHGNGFASVMTMGEGSGAAYCVATWWPALGSAWTWGHYTEALADAESAWADVTARNASRGPRSLSAAANPDAPARRLRARRMARNRAELMAEIDAAEREHGPDSLAAELARSGLAVATASGGFPLYAFRDGFAHDADSLDSLAYGSAIGGLR